MSHKELDMTERVTLSAFFIVQLSHPYMTTRKANRPCTDLGGQSHISASVRSLLFLCVSVCVCVCVCVCMYMYVYIHFVTLGNLIDNMPQKSKASSKMLLNHFSVS